MGMPFTGTLLCLLLAVCVCSAEEEHVCAAACQQKSIFGRPCYGCMIPENPYAYVGEILKLNCTTYDANETHGLFFTRGNDEPISEDYQRVISADTLQLSMPVMADMSGVTLACFYNITVSPWKHIGGQVLEVEYKPRDVSSNVTAIVRNWKNLTLTADVGKFLHWQNIKVDITWTAATARGWYKCDSSWRENELFVCFLDKNSFKSSSEYWFNISVEDTKTSYTAVTTVSFIMNNIVQPAPVESLKGVGGRRQANLSWELDPAHKTQPFEYFVTTDDMERNWTTDDRFLLIEDIHPDRDYEFSVSVKSKLGGYWSTPKNIKIRTKIDIPESSANLPQGSYFYTFPCHNRSRNVYIYLKEPDKKDQNGPLTNYLMSWRSSSGDRSLNVSYDVNETLLVHSVSCDASYDFFIYSVNEAGTSPASKLHMPKDASVKRPKRVMVEVNNATVTWEAETGTVPLQWTVFWCRKFIKQFPDGPTCEAEFDWLILEGSARSVQLPLQPQDVNQDHIYGVSVRTADGYSSIRWHDCLYRFDKNPWDLPERPNLDSVSEEPSLGLTVTWSLNTCPDETLITKYVIKHCNVGSSSCATDEVPSSQNSLVIENLEEGHNYSVQIQQLSVSGRPGKLSEPVYAAPVFIGLLSWQVGLIAFFAVIFVVVVMIAVGCAVYYLRRKVSEREKVVIPTTQDNIDTSSNLQAVVDEGEKSSRSSTDSGHHSSGSPPPEEEENPDPESPEPSAISDVTVPRNENSYSRIAANDERQAAQTSNASSRDQGELNDAFQSDCEDEIYIAAVTDEKCKEKREKSSMEFEDAKRGLQTVVDMSDTGDTDMVTDMVTQV